MKYNRSVFHAATMITQFGINMLVPIFLCTFAGIFLDRILETSWICILLFFVGALAGFRNVFQFAKKIYSMESDTRNRNLAQGYNSDKEKESEELRNEEKDS